MRVMMLLLTLFMCCMATPAQATDALFDRACARYRVPKQLLLAIAHTESRLYPWAVNVSGKSYRPSSRTQALQIIHAARKRGLSYDVGMMQINNWWLKRLRISPEQALEPQNNILLGAYILASELRRHGYNWRAVGAYHSPTPSRQRLYAKVVAKHYFRGGK